MPIYNVMFAIFIVLLLCLGIVSVVEAPIRTYKALVLQQMN